MVELHFEREGLFPLMIVFWFEYSLPRIDLGTEGHGGTRRRAWEQEAKAGDSVP